MSERLSIARLGRLAPDIRTPRYDLADVRPGIVHLGVGNFHRAHQAVATDDVLNAGQTGWGIAGVSIRHKTTRDALAPQDFLYSVTARDGQTANTRIIGALRHIYVLSEQPRRIIAAMADPSCRILSLTVTEKGYWAQPGTGVLVTGAPAIQADLSGRAAPGTTIGLLAAALAQRFQDSRAPVTLLSCDNLPDNGHVLKRALAGFMDEKYPEAGKWMRDAVSFPRTMVDRIVPATSAATREAAADRLGCEDAAAIETEPFFQWVIEDHFAAGRPDWGLAGAEIVSDVAPFESMKLRLLNGAHTTLAAAGRLVGYETVAQAMADPDLSALIARLWAEAGRTLAPGLDQTRYMSSLALRFRNPALPHRLEQIAMDGSQKITQRIVDPLRELRAAGQPADAVVFALAVWIRSNCGRSDAGQDLPVNDPVLSKWTRRMDPDNAPATLIVREWLARREVFGSDLAEDENLVRDIADVYQAVRSQGVLAVAAKRTSELRR